MTRVRHGYILIYVVIAVAAVAAVATLVAPTVASTGDRARLASTAVTLRALEASADSFALHVGVFPGAVSELTTQIATTDKNSCQTAMTSTNVSNWTTSGPFLKTMFAGTNGIYTPVGRLTNAIPTRTLGKNDVYIDIPGVDTADASALHRYIDGSSGTIGDTVSTVPTSPTRDTTTIRFRIVKGSSLSTGTC